MSSTPPHLKEREGRRRGEREKQREKKRDPIDQNQIQRESNNSSVESANNTSASQSPFFPPNTQQKLFCLYF
jgi:hypothetical protein